MRPVVGGCPACRLPPEQPAPPSNPRPPTNPPEQRVVRARLVDVAEGDVAVSRLDLRNDAGQRASEPWVAVRCRGRQMCPAAAAAAVQHSTALLWGSVRTHPQQGVRWPVWGRGWAPCGGSQAPPGREPMWVAGRTSRAADGWCLSPMLCSPTRHEAVPSRCRRPFNTARTASAASISRGAQGQQHGPAAASRPTPLATHDTNRLA